MGIQVGKQWRCFTLFKSHTCFGKAELNKHEPVGIVNSPLGGAARETLLIGCCSILKLTFHHEGLGKTRPLKWTLSRSCCRSLRRCRKSESFPRLCRRCPWTRSLAWEWWPPGTGLPLAMTWYVETSLIHWRFACKKIDADVITQVNQHPLQSQSVL